MSAEFPTPRNHCPSPGGGAPHSDVGLSGPQGDKYICPTWRSCSGLTPCTSAPGSGRQDGDPPAADDAVPADICGVQPHSGPAAAVYGLRQTLWQHEYGEAMCTRWPLAAGPMLAAGMRSDVPAWQGYSLVPGGLTFGRASMRWEMEVGGLQLDAAASSPDRRGLATSGSVDS